MWWIAVCIEIMQEDEYIIIGKVTTKSIQTFNNEYNFF